MDIRKLQRAIVDGLEDVKAQNIRVFNTEHLSPLFERVIVATGASNRQTKSLAASVRETVKSRGMQVLRTEGEENGEWIIVDCGAAVAHIMQPSIRDYYHLEEIWGDKPVHMKIDTSVKRLVKAAEPAPAAKAAPAQRTTAKAAPAKKAVARTGAKPSPRSSTKTTAKTAPRKASSATKPAGARAPAPAKRGVSRTVGVKKAAAKVARTTAAKKAAAPRRGR
jgi:ribosome-associated protein